MKNRRKAVQPFEIKKRKIDIFRNYEANGFEKNQRKFENFSTLISKKSTEAIARDCEDHGRRNQIYGFYFYENNPATSVGAVFKLILKDCGFLFSSKK